MKYSENAVTAKVHALYAKRLTDTDYANLLSFHSNEEIFNYLRSETSYSEYLGTLPSVTLSRSRFENVLNKSLLGKKASLCRFQKLIGDEAYRYFIKKDEIDTILYCARHLDTQVITDLYERPPVYTAEQNVSGENLQKATSFEEFAAILSETPYKKLIEPVLLFGNSYQSLAALERILFNTLYTDVKTVICKKYKGKVRDEILDYIKFISDMGAISSFYRLAENFSDSQNYKMGILRPSVTAFTEKDFQRLEASVSADDVLSAVRHSVYGKYFAETPENIDLFVRRLIVKKSVKNIRYSQNPELSLFSYEAFMKNEITNIIHIIEGVKYGLAPIQISDLIVKGGC